jgi:hypothetical protein
MATQKKITDLFSSNPASPDLTPALKRKHLSTPGTPEEFDLDEHISKIVDSKLAQALIPYMETIEKLSAIITEKDARIKELEDRVEILSATSPPSTITTGQPAIEKRDIEKRLDDLEQRSRSWNLRLSGVKSDIENTDDIVIDVANSIGVTIRKEDIDWSHYVGKPDASKGTRQIIVKMVRRQDWLTFIKARRGLRKEENRHSSVYINEDLTSARFNLLRTLLSLKRDGKLHSAWCYQGNIHYRVTKDDKPVRIRDVSVFNTSTI